MNPSTSTKTGRTKEMIGEAITGVIGGITEKRGKREEETGIIRTWMIPVTKIQMKGNSFLMTTYFD